LINYNENNVSQKLTEPYLIEANNSGRLFCVIHHDDGETIEFFRFENEKAKIISLDHQKEEINLIPEEFVNRIEQLQPPSHSKIQNFLRIFGKINNSESKKKYFFFF
jgi:hypothetical protein